MSVSISYGSAYSFSSINNQLDFDSVEAEINKLQKKIEEFNDSVHNKIEFSTDYTFFLIDGFSLQDNLLEITKDENATIYLLGEIEKKIGKHKSYLDTPTMLQEVMNNDVQELPQNYPFTLQREWAGISKSLHIFSYLNTCNLNSRHFKNGVTTEKQFTEKAINIYEHIQFHENFESKLNTIIRGKFTEYLSEFSHALNTLNQSYFSISKDGSQNEHDLEIIAKISRDENLEGRSLTCTRQGKNKPFFDFPNLKIKQVVTLQDGTEEIVHPKESVNCEYHLKLNFNDQGIRLPDDYNRAYFGLKYCDITKRKYIKLAYIGEHWPPKVKGKKRK